MKKLLICLVISCFLVSCSSTHRSSSAASASIKTDEAHDGSSIEKAIIIKAKTEEKGVAAEYDWLKKNYPGYKFMKQSLRSIDNKHYDVMQIKTADDAEKIIYFDITNFFGKGFGF